MGFSVSEDNECYSVHDGILYVFEMRTAVRFPENYNHDVVELPRTVVTIGEWCFSRCMKLIDNVFPRRLENVCLYAFHDSCNIASLTLGDSIKEFDISALDGYNSRKVLTIYESLQANGQDYSPNSYAMTLYNASIISMEQSEYKTAMEYVKKACYIWKKLLQSTTDEQINAYLAEAQRLIMFLERKMK